MIFNGKVKEPYKGFHVTIQYKNKSIDVTIETGNRGSITAYKPMNDIQVDLAYAILNKINNRLYL